jgi:O-antigen ligase
MPKTHLFIEAFEHGEDAPDASSPHNFQMRTRRFLWKTAWHDYLSHPWFGVGFIREVPSEIYPGTPNTRSLESIVAPPMNGAHCSYLTVLTRMGPLGLALFFLLILEIAYATRQVLQSSEGLKAPSLIFFAIIVNGLLYALVNVGFESPHNCMVLWLASGILLAHARRLSHENTFRS